jgi:hypothetical protein
MQVVHIPWSSIFIVVSFCLLFGLLGHFWYLITRLFVHLITRLLVPSITRLVVHLISCLLLKLLFNPCFADFKLYLIRSVIFQPQRSYVLCHPNG